MATRISTNNRFRFAASGRIWDRSFTVRVLSFVLLLGFVRLSCAQDKDAASGGKSAPAEPSTTGPAPSAHAPSDGTYVIGPDDLLAINVWREPEISRSVPVRSDGHISLPLLGEVQAAGETPRQLQEEISRKLKSYISEPDVAVIVQEARSHRFNVLGQVNHPGEYLLANTTTVLDAIAVAGGFKDFAKQKSIYVLRQNPDGTQSRLPFNYKDMVKGKNIDQNVKLQPRDTVIVP
jgi:polysaccharide biosynthesis/export protein